MSSCSYKPSVSDCNQCKHRENNPICSAAPEVANILNQHRKTLTFQVGDTLFQEGESPVGLYTITDGLVKLESVSSAGSAHTLRWVTTAGPLGYRSLFANEPYSASAIALTPVEVCFTPKNIILQILKDFPHAAVGLLEHLAKDLRQAEEKWIRQVDRSATERIAEALVFLQDHFAGQVWTRKEIAQWAGTTPETVIRTLSQFEREGLLDQSDGRMIRVLSAQKLKEKYASNE